MHPLPRKLEPEPSNVTSSMAGEACEKVLTSVFDIFVTSVSLFPTLPSAALYGQR